MKLAANRNEVALLGQQELPPALVESAEYAPLNGHSRWEAEPAIRTPSEAAVPMWPTALAEVDARSRVISLPAEEASGSRDAAQERLFREIDAEVRLISATKADTLSVLLKPDSETEILLHLRLRDGQVEAHARCQRGDFQTLNSEWGQLQERLSGCGVRLTPLALPTGNGYEWQHSSADRFGASTQFQNHRQPQARPEIMEEQADAPSAQWWPGLRARWRRSAACRLLESWA